MLAEALQPLKDAIAAATESRQPLRITGHGSKDFYGGDLVGTPLSTQALNGITAYEPSELFVSVLAGTPIGGLEALLLEQRQRLAFEPPRFGGQGTVGGMVATGLSGPSRAALGQRARPPARRHHPERPGRAAVLRRHGDEERGRL